MKATTQRGLTTAVKFLIDAPEFERIRAFLTADASAAEPEAPEIIKFVGDEIRNHLVTHSKAVQAVRRGL